MSVTATVLPLLPSLVPLVMDAIQDLGTDATPEQVNEHVTRALHSAESKAIDIAADKARERMNAR